MNEKRAITAALAAVSLTLCVGCATPADMKPTRAWDQAAVTTLAGDLADRVEKAFAASNRQTVEFDQMESVNSYLNNLRILQRQSRELHTGLQAGKGYQETLWIFEEIKQHSRVTWNSPDWRMIEGDLGGTKVSIVAVLDQLDGYYGKR